MKTIRFFAVDTDLLDVLTEVERTTRLRYVRTGVFDAPDPIVYTAAASIPELGIANEESAINCSSYLVVDYMTEVTSRKKRLNDGKCKYFIDQLMNPDSVVLTPAGKWAGRTVLYGTVGTASDSDLSAALMKKFQRSVKKQFRKLKAFWVGENADRLFNEGWRLTIAEQSPTEFDLSSR